MVLDDLPMWGMLGETLRDDKHGRMEKVLNKKMALCFCFQFLFFVSPDG
jgi:hypothetical protein